MTLDLAVRTIRNGTTDGVVADHGVTNDFMGIAFALAGHKSSDGFIRGGFIAVFKLSGSSNDLIKSDSAGKTVGSNNNVVIEEGRDPGVKFRRKILNKMINNDGLGELNFDFGELILNLLKLLNEIFNVLAGGKSGAAEAFHSFGESTMTSGFITFFQGIMGSLEVLILLNYSLAIRSTSLPEHSKGLVVFEVP